MSYRFEKPFERKTKTRICPGCGVLLDAGDTRCDNCQAIVSPQSLPGTRLWLKRNVNFQGQVTFGLIVLNFFLFFLGWLLSQDKNGFLMTIDLGILNRLGAKNTVLIAAGQVWRLVTATFLHANLMHIFFNMMALLSLGRIVEELYGWQRYLFFYVIAGALGNVASIVYYPGVLGIGASGAIMGLAGVLMATSVKHWKTYGQLIGKSLLRWVMYVLLIGFFLSRYVDNAAHVGGLVAGFLIALPFSTSQVRTELGKLVENALGLGAVALVFASFLGMVLSH